MGYTFCVIEDRDEDFFLAQHAIEKGFPDANIIHARSCEDAKKIATDWHVDFFIVDNGLPDGEGLDVVSSIARSNSLIILCSGAADVYRKTLLETYKNIIDGYIPKPLTLEKLNAVFRGARWKSSRKE